MVSPWITVPYIGSPAFLSAWYPVKLAIWRSFFPTHSCRPLSSVQDLVLYSLAHSPQTGIPTQNLALPQSLFIFPHGSCVPFSFLQSNSFGLGVLLCIGLHSPHCPLPCSHPSPCTIDFHIASSCQASLLS